jgi:hypothetical protein
MRRKELWCHGACSRVSDARVVRVAEGESGRSVQCLNLALLIHTQNQRPFGRVQVKTHHIPHFLLEVRIVGHSYKAQMIPQPPTTPQLAPNGVRVSYLRLKRGLSPGTAGRGRRKRAAFSERLHVVQRTRKLRGPLLNVLFPSGVVGQHGVVEDQCVNEL